MKKFFKLSVIIFVSIFLIGTTLVTAGDVVLTEEGKVPGKPFAELQKQIDELRELLNLHFDQYCPENQFVTGIDTDGLIICGPAEVSSEIVAIGMGAENHLVRSRIILTDENLQQVTYIMGCQKSEGSIGPVGTDPFASSHANYLLEFGPGLAGATLDAIAVEIYDSAESDAFVELKDPVNNFVLATSNVISTSSVGWLEFEFIEQFTIGGSQILVNFETTNNNARAYNCASVVEFIPD